MSYLIQFSRRGNGQYIRFGLNPELEFADLAHAFELAQEDVEASVFPSSEVDENWGTLTLTAETELTLKLEVEEQGYILFVSDSATGSSTSTGVKSLADAFDFITYWAMENFE